MRNNYYVYAYLREDGSPYYIGKGTGRRAFQKSKRHKFVKMPEDKSNIVFLSENLTEDVALAEEKRLIAHYGRKINGGILINIGEGGEVRGRPAGWKHTEETKKKMRGKRPNANVHRGPRNLPPRKRKCIYRDKEFESFREAAEHFGVSEHSVRRYVRKREAGFVPQISHAKPCVVKGIHFDMRKTAAEYFGVSKQTIINWIKEGK
jgi:hypothetical protein